MNNIIFKKMCEASANYLWDLGDKIGSGATSIVYKAYNIKTGEIVAAKVSKTRSVIHNVESDEDAGAQKKSNYRSVFDREKNFLKDLNHDNIVRFIGIELVNSSDNVHSYYNQEVLLLEYCNGGTVTEMLRSPAYRYGLPEDLIMQIIRDVISALKYLYGKKIIHRDIKPDNIMQSIDINGKSTFKLTDLGAARQINPGEQTSDSIRGTEEYVHPAVYLEVFPEIKLKCDGKTQTRKQFPFEVEMWSFGVTLYQCCTGQIPFQPFDTTRRDRDTMRKILTNIPRGCISGRQCVENGEIQYSKNLPEWCRLSPNVTKKLEKLMARLFETNQERLTKHEEFFDEIDKILYLTPIYYLNLKKFQLTLAYFPSDQFIDKLFDEIRQENGDDKIINYYCLFQNIYYPISTTERISIKTFLEQLPILPSREKPLIIYPFSSLIFDQKCLPKVNIPELQPMKTIRHIFFSVYDWSNDLTGLFFYIKTQLMDYEYILKITQSSIMTMHRFLKSKLNEFLSVIRRKILDYEILREFQKIIDFIESQNNSTLNNTQSSPVTSLRPYHKSIIKSTHTDTTCSQESTSTSSQNEKSLRIRSILESSTDLYQKLIEYNKELSTITDKNFSNQLSAVDDPQLILYASYLAKQTNNYSLNIQRIDKYVKDAVDLSDRFRQDLSAHESSPLKMTSHRLRQKHLEELHVKFIRFVNEECYPLILEIFNEYKKWINQQTDINYTLQRIQVACDNQCKNYMSIIDSRQIIRDELKKMNITDISSISDHLSSNSSQLNQEIPQDQQPTTTTTTINIDEKPIHSNTSKNVKKTVINDIRATIQKLLEEARNNSNMLEDIIGNVSDKQYI